MKMAIFCRFYCVFLLSFSSRGYSESLSQSFYADSYYVEFVVAFGDHVDEVGTFVLEIIPEWAPIGAAHLNNLIQQKYYDSCKFFRVLPKFITQFGLNGNPQITKKYQTTIKDEIESAGNKASNIKGTVTFAMRGKNTRSTHLFINHANNKNLDKEGFSPIGRVIYGMNIVEKLNSEYKEKPNQGKITNNGNKYLDKEFPRLSYIISSQIVDYSNINTHVSHFYQTLVSCQLIGIKKPIIIEIKENWAPIGAYRFLSLVHMKFYDNTPIFRVIKDVLFQFGLYNKDRTYYLHSIKDSSSSSSMDKETLGNDIFNEIVKDDAFINIPFLKGMISFAGSGDETRNTQVFISLNKLHNHDDEGSSNEYSIEGSSNEYSIEKDHSKWERPFGFVQFNNSIDAIREIYTKYGDLTPNSDPNQHGPNIHQLYNEKLSPITYLEQEFPKLTYINKCEIISLSPNSSFKFETDTIKEYVQEKDNQDIDQGMEMKNMGLTAYEFLGLLYLFLGTFLIVYRLLQFLGDGDISVSLDGDDEMVFKDL